MDTKTVDESRKETQRNPPAILVGLRIKINIFRIEIGQEMANECVFHRIGCQTVQIMSKRIMDNVCGSVAQSVAKANHVWSVDRVAQDFCPFWIRIFASALNGCAQQFFANVQRLFKLIPIKAPQIIAQIGHIHIRVCVSFENETEIRSLIFADYHLQCLRWQIYP